MIKLTITEKGGEPRALSFDQNEVSIGRVQGNDIVLPKGNISKRHSKLTLSDGKMVVSDAKSTNGTYVNGRKITDVTAVRPGDKIFVGDFLIVIDPAGATAEISSTGSRRNAPPPPPPPPPRPGSARHVAPPLAGLSSDAGGVDDSDGGLGSLGDPGPSTGRGRPPAPPPPPPRRTIATAALQDDSADIGADDGPPSPEDVDLGMGDLPAGVNGMSGDLGDEGVSARGMDGPVELGHDVFGASPAHEEDIPATGDFGGAAARFGLAAKSQADVDGDGDALAGIPTPAPSTASTRAPLGLAPASAGDTHAPAASSLDALLADSTVTGILISVGGGMQVDRAGRIETIAPIGDGNAIAETVWQLANTAVPSPASDNPVVDVRLPDGTRLTALFPPITPTSVCAIIRKLGAPQLPLADLAGSGDVEAILRAAVISRRNLLLAGDVPAVATLLGALAETLPRERRVVSVGMGSKGHPGWIEVGPGLDPAGLARAALAFRGDHLLFADAGGAELPELLLAAARGQDGTLACIAARSAAEALLRLRAFASAAVGPQGFAALVTSTVDLIVVVGSSATGGVRVLEIAEPEAQGENLTAAFVARRPERNRATTTLDVSGVSSRLAGSIAATAEALPGHLVRR